MAHDDIQSPFPLPMSSPSHDVKLEQQEQRPQVNEIPSPLESAVNHNDIVEEQPHSRSKDFRVDIREREPGESEQVSQPSSSSTDVQDQEKERIIGENNQILSTAPVFEHTSTLQSNSRSHTLAWLKAVATCLITIFSVYYSYRVLVSKSLVPENLALSPGKTVLVVNVLSHVVAFLCWDLFASVSEVLRWSLACRPDKGILLTSFLTLSRATPASGLLYLSLKKGTHQVWCAIRLLSVAFHTIVGLILITDITFMNIYNSPASSLPIKVVAGTAPFNSEFVSMVPTSVLSVFAFSYTMSFLADQRYVINIPPVHCNSDHCSSITSIFLPGSLDLVVIDNDDPTPTYLATHFSGESVLIHDAPGYQVEFSSVDSDYIFPAADCNMYMNSLNDGLYVCIAAKGPQMIIGWTICPLGATCVANATWTQTPDQITTVSMYKRYSTTAYDLKNLSILSIESITAPETTKIDTTDFALFCSLLLGPIPKVLNFTSDPSAYQMGATKYAIQYALGLVLRELKQYQDDFNTFNSGAMSLLQSLVALSFQFSTEIWQQGSVSSLPPDMKVTATLTTTSYRAMVPPWTVWLFAVVAFTILLWSIACLTWISRWGAKSPNASNFPEIDVTSKSSLPKSSPAAAATKLVANDRDAEAPYESVEDLGKYLRKGGLGNGPADSFIKSIHDTKIYCGSYADPISGQEMVVIVTDRGIVSPLKEDIKYA